VLRYDGAFDPSYFGSAQSGVAVNLANGTATGGGAGGAGSARLVNIEHVSGTPFGDVLIGDGGSNSLTGLAGGDALDGGAGIDWLTGGVGADDFIFGATPGAANRDTLEDFEPGVDTIRLDATVMPALGPSGRFTADDARFYAADGATSGHDPDDRVVYDTFSGLLYYDADGSGAGAALEIATLQIPDPDGPAPVLAASDILVVNGSAPGNVIVGTSGPDTLTGTSGNDTINGLEGNDLFLAGSTGGNDVINGGAGRDSIEFKERATSAITVDFVAGTISGGSSGTISFTSIERILTGNFDDTLTGNGASQTLTGQSGADTLWGAGGTDTLWGGQGADAFIFREMGANADRISDFATGADKLHLDDAAFTAIGATGSFGAGDGRFVANSSGTAQDAGDRVVFNTSFGQLYYDADGSGSGAAPQLIATVQAGATVAATDIVVI
jgi:Ca2+-binding RTX toxin-like protein